MAKVKGVLKHASVPVRTASGNPSEVRAVDPGDTVVEIDSQKDPQSVLEAVRRYCQALSSKKEAEEKAAEAAEVLRAYVGELRKERAEQGDYQKTFRVIGERLNRVVFAADVSQADRWSLVKGVDPKKVRAKDPDNFDLIAEEETTISIKEEVLSNRAERLALSRILEEALGVEGIRKYFKKDTVWVVREGMERRQYTLPPEQHALLTEAFKQATDSVKDARQKVD